MRYLEVTVPEGKREIEAVLAEPQYDGLESDDVAVELDGDYPIQSVERVVVTVTGRNPEPESGLADRLYEEISPHSDESLLVEVRYVVAEERGDESETQRVAIRTADGT